MQSKNAGKRLKAVPEDNKTRLELGQMLVKCGLYLEAETELLQRFARFFLLRIRHI